MGRQCEVRTIRLDKIRGLSREEGEARRIVESFARYAMSRATIAPSGTMNGSAVVLSCVYLGGAGCDNTFAEIFPHKAEKGASPPSQPTT
jgi:hypothetical protein